MEWFLGAMKHRVGHKVERFFIFVAQVTLYSSRMTVFDGFLPPQWGDKLSAAFSSICSFVGVPSCKLSSFLSSVSCFHESETTHF